MTWSSALPVVEKWETYMLPNHSSFAAINESLYLRGIDCQLLWRRRKTRSYGKSFASNVANFWEEIVSTIFSTVAARSLVGQSLSCSWPEHLIGRDNWSAFYLFGQLVEGRVALNWLEDSDIGAGKTVFHSLVLEQRQVEKNAGKPQVRIKDILSLATTSPVSARAAIYADCVFSGLGNCQLEYFIQYVCAVAGFSVDRACGQRSHGCTF